MLRRPPKPTRTDLRFPYPEPFRSLGGQDEEWFVLVHIAIEGEAGRALHAITAAQEAVASDRPDRLAEELGLVARTLETLHAILLRMPERCDPYRSEEHTSELQSLMRTSYAVFCLKKTKNTNL